MFDPWIVYDHHVDRFVAIAVRRVFAAIPAGYILLAISKDSTPTDLTPSNWYYYQFNVGGTGPAASFPDYAKLGYDDAAYYMTSVNFLIVGGTYVGSSIFKLTKASILGGGAAVFSTITSGFQPSFGVFLPIQIYDSSPAAM